MSFRNSRWPVNTITINCAYSSTGIGAEFTVTETVNFSHVYTRVLPTVAESIFAAKCGDPEALVNFLEPGQFCLVDVDKVNLAETNPIRFSPCCCPCRPVLVFKPLELTAASVPDGLLTWTRTDGGDPHDPPTEDLYATESFNILPKYCREAIAHPDSYVYDPVRLPSTITIARDVTGTEISDEEPFGVNEEQTILLSDGKLFFGDAHLRWVAPDHTVFDFTLTAPNIISDAHGIPFARLTLLPEVPGLQVTAETNGLRIGFIGRYAARSVNLFTEVSSTIEHPQTLEMPPPNQAYVHAALFKKIDGEFVSNGALILAPYDVAGNCPAAYDGESLEISTVDMVTTSLSLGQTWA